MTGLQRYESATLGVLTLCIGALYGLVAGEWTAQRFAAGIADRYAEGAGLSEKRSDGVSVAQVTALFETVDYRLGRVEAGETAVPRIFVESIPKDLHTVGSGAERKRLFIKLALPLILAANERTLAERRRLIALRTRAARIRDIHDAKARAWAETLRARYGVESDEIDVLLRHVDVIPPSLALAQAAEESGWGTSRFAREGNALFGQRIYAPDAGIVPAEREDGEYYEVRAFDSLAGSVASYMANLNSHEAYEALREVRAAQRRAGVALDGYTLAGTLGRYSERGTDYVETIRSIIRANRLESFDRAGFGGASEPNI